MNERDILIELIELGHVSTKKLDIILEKAWGNKRDAQMHCNSMLKRGLIDYMGDGDWEVCITLADLDCESN